MDLLEGWLRQHVHQALTEALRWKIDASKSFTLLENARFEDEGSNLRIKSTEKFLVQITKIEQATSPITVWISDSQTHVKVIIATAAAENFKRAHRKRITEGTLGAIFQLTNFEIVVQYYGPTRSKITMLIKGLKHIGSDGSSAFGSPRPMECLEDVQAALHELEAFRAEDATCKETNRIHATPIQNITPSFRPNNATSLDADTDLSQAVFATQAPRLASRKRSRPTSDSQAGNVSSEAPESRLGSNDPTADQKPEEIILKRAAATINSEVNYRKLVESRNGANVLSGHRHGDAQESSEAKVRQPINIDGFAGHKQYLLNLLAGKSKPKVVEVQVSAVENEANQEGEASKQLPQESPTSREASFSVSQSRNLPDIDKVSPKPPGSEETSTSESPVNRESLAQISKQRQMRTSKGIMKPRRLLHHISLKEIRIPKNQRDLLERSDAWLPPEPGHRAPTANLPITILEELNKRADQKTNSRLRPTQRGKSTPLQKQKHSSDLPDADDQGSAQLSSSDDLIPTSQWPPSSPEQSLLPPDSSVETTEQTQYPDDQDIHCEDRINLDKTNIYSELIHEAPDASLSPASKLARKRHSSQEAETGHASPPSPPMASSGSSRFLPRNAKQIQTSTTGFYRETPSLNGNDVNNEQNNDSSDSFPEESSSSHDAQEINNHDDQNIDVHDDHNNDHHVHNLNHSHDSIRINSFFDNHLMQHNESPSEASEIITSSQNSRKCLSTKFVGPYNSTLLKSRIRGHQSSPLPERSRFIDTQISSGSRMHGEPMQKSMSDINFEVDSTRNGSLDLSDSESELETTLPHALDRLHGLNENFASQSLPSTAFQPSTPITQVKQTPYVNGFSNSGSERSILSIKQDRLPAACMDEQALHAPQLDSIDLGNSSVEIDTTNVDDNSILKRRKSTYREEAVANSSEASHGSPGDDQLCDRVNEAAAIVSTVDQAILSIEETVLPMEAVEEPQIPSTQDIITPNVSIQNIHDLKRKASEPLSLSPNVNKRRKRPFPRAISDLSHVSIVHQNPAVSGRQWRSEYLASLRRSSGTDQTRETSSNISKRPVSGSLDPGARHSSTSTPHEQLTGLNVQDSDNISQAPAKVSKQDFANINQLRKAGSNPDHNMSSPQYQPSSRSQDSDTGLSPLFGDSSIRPRHSRSPETAYVTVQNLVSRESPHTQGESNIPRAKVENPPHKTANSVYGPLAFDTTSVPMQIPVLTTSIPYAAEALHTAGQTVSEIGSTSGTVGTYLSIRKRSPSKDVQPVSPTNEMSLFDQFKTAYPEYPGTLPQFAKICDKIKSLVEASRMEHPALWDDFIIRHKTDYPAYTHQLIEDALDPVAYEVFYRNYIEEPKYTKRIVTPKKLQELLPSPHAELVLKGTQVQQVPVKVVEQNSKPQTAQGESKARFFNASSTAVATLEGSRELRGHRRIRNKSKINIDRGSSHQFSWSASSRTENGESDLETDQAQQSSKIRSRNVEPRSDAKKGKSEELSDAVGGASAPPSSHAHRKVIDLTEDLEDHPKTATRAISPPTPSARHTRRSLQWAASGSNGTSNLLAKDRKFKAVLNSSPVSSTTKKRPCLTTAILSISSPSRDSRSSLGKSASKPPPLSKNLEQASKGSTSTTSQSPGRTHPQHKNDQVGLDEDTPYRTYKRQWDAIVPGKGNSYAKINNGSHASPKLSTSDRKFEKSYTHNPSNLFL